MIPLVGFFTDFAKDAGNNLWHQGIAPTPPAAGLYLGLAVGDPLRSGAPAELTAATAPGYARVATAGAWQVVATDATPPGTPFVQAGAGGAWPAGTWYFVETLTQPGGETGPSAEFALTVAAGNQTLTAYSPAGTGSAWNLYAGQQSGGPYYRAASTPLGTNATLAGAAPTSGLGPPVVGRHGGLVVNALAVAFPANSGASPWPTAYSVFAADAATGGNVIWTARLTPDATGQGQTVPPGKALQFAPFALSVQM